MGLEPLYSLAVACEIIPIRGTTLRVILHRYKEKFPPRYNMDSHKGAGGPERMLTESECLAIRDMVIRPDRKASRLDLGVFRDRTAARKLREPSEVDKYLLGEATG